MIKKITIVPIAIKITINVNPIHGRFPELNNAINDNPPIDDNKINAIIATIALRIKFNCILILFPPCKKQVKFCYPVDSFKCLEKIKIDPKENFKDEDNAWLGL